MNRYFLLLLTISTLTLNNCTLDKGAVIPTGATNEKVPTFLSSDIAAISFDSISAIVRLSTRGNLNIQHHGWAWSENANPTIQNETIDLGPLSIDSFETKIPRLSLGKTYRLRPYVTTGSGVTYGLEKTITMNISKLGDVSVVTNSACLLLVQSNVQSSVALVNYGIVYMIGTGTPTLQKNDGKLAGATLNNNIFLASVPNLSPLTTYSVRSYATTTAGIGYGAVKQITTPANSTIKADFSINTDEELFQGAIVQFTNSSIGSTSYDWRFGDGDSSAQVSPIHTFNTLGKMIVRLTAKNSSGCTMTKDINLNIIPDPFKGYWVSIPGGSFTMGCTTEQGTDCRADEKPAHQVTLSPFFIGKTEITQGQYKAVVSNNPSGLYQCGLDCPVESVSWTSIVDVFIPALFRKTGRKYALPTEAQWEYAARGGLSASTMTKYAGSNNKDDVAWHGGNSGSTTHAVAQKAPNGYGLFDMSGNVREYCYDLYNATYYTSSPSTNPIGPPFGQGFDNYNHVSRGGSSFELDSRTTTRFNCQCVFFVLIGFRLVRNE